MYVTVCLSVCVSVSVCVCLCVDVFGWVLCVWVSEFVCMCLSACDILCVKETAAAAEIHQNSNNVINILIFAAVSLTVSVPSAKNNNNDNNSYKTKTKPLKKESNQPERLPASQTWKVAFTSHVT